MKELSELIKDPREWNLERVTGSRCLCVGPCLFQFISVVPTSTQSDILVKVFDGQNDQGRQKVTIKDVYSHVPVALPQPAFFRRGLYVDLTTNVSEATLQYMPLKD